MASVKGEAAGPVKSSRFRGQACVVTGGASGIGKAVARRLAREGGKVVLFDQDAPGMERVQGEFAKESLRVMAVRVRVEQEESVKAGIERVLNAAKRLDVVVNCAGVTDPGRVKLADYRVEDFDRLYEVNLRGSFLVAKHASAPMIERNYGRILLVSSIAGKEGNPTMPGYSASKAGVIGLVKSLGKELAETGVRVNGLAPAVIRTPLVGAMSRAQVKYMTDKIPMRRTGTLEEAASIAAWIVSPECSFTTGFVFDLSGGRATY